MKKTMLLVGLMVLSNVSLPAQTKKHSRIVHVKEKSAIHVAPQEAPAGLKTIYTNLGPKGDLYLDSDGWELTGFNSFGGESNAFEVAMPFTPKSNAHVSQLRAAVQYLGYGANQINLSLYSDAAGVPGTLLAGPVTVTNLADSGTCCTLADASFNPVAVTAGTRYWVVANTPASGQGSDFVGVWDWVSKIILFSGSNGVDGWQGINVDGLPAGAVLGTIP